MTILAKAIFRGNNSSKLENYVFYPTNINEESAMMLLKQIIILLRVVL